MKLILTTDEGVLLDETDVTREEWADAQHRSVAALDLICSLEAGKEEQPDDETRHPAG